MVCLFQCVVRACVFHSVVFLQTLFDLEFLSILLCGKGLPVHQVQKWDARITPPSLRFIWRPEEHVNLAALQTRIRAQCLTELVDRLFYSSESLR